MPVTQCVTDVNSIFDAAGELFGLGEFQARYGLSSFEHVGSKLLDQVIFWRVAALRVRIPLNFPPFSIHVAGTGV